MRAYFYATFLEKVAQKAAFRETLIPPGFLPPGWLNRIAQGPFPIRLDALRRVESLFLLLASVLRSAFK